MTRDYRTGSIYFRERDRLWIGTIEAGWTAKGTRRRVVVSSASEAKCKQKLKEKAASIAKSGLPVEGISSKATVKTWADQWLVIKKKKIRPSSFSGHQSAVRRWIIPTIGKRRLADITPADIRAVSEAILRPEPGTRFPEGRSSTLAKSVQGILLRCLADAIVEGHPVPARVLGMNAPTAAVSDREDVPLEDIIAMLALVEDLPDGSRWAAAFMAGLRQAEALGLTWDRVDLAAGTLDISWQLQAIPFDHRCGAEAGRKFPCGRRFAGDCPQRHLRVPEGFEHRQLEGGLCLTRPKTNKGKRLIPIVPWLADAFVGWRQVAPSSPHGLVWPQPDGSPRRAKEDLAKWKELEERAGVTKGKDGVYVLHEARHSTATLLSKSQVDPEVIKAIMGHSSIATSMIYVHTDLAMAREAMEKVAARLRLPVRPEIVETTLPPLDLTPAN